MITKKQITKYPGLTHSYIKQLLEIIKWQEKELDLFNTYWDSLPEDMSKMDRNLFIQYPEKRSNAELLAKAWEKEIKR